MNSPLRKFLRMVVGLVVLSHGISAAALELSEATRQFYVLDAEKKRVAYLVRGDWTSLERMLADDLVYVHSDGRLENKEEFLGSLRGGTLRYHRIDHEDETVRLHDNTAVITAKYWVESTAHGQEFKVRLQVTLVYVFRDSRWQLFSWQSLRLPYPTETVQASKEQFPLWDPSRKQSDEVVLPMVSGVSYSLVQAPTADYAFLHEPRLSWHKGELFVSFSNAPLRESEPAQVVRLRRSRDGGSTWSAPSLVAPNPPGGHRYETAPLLSTEAGLFAFLGRYGVGGRNSLGMEVWLHDEVSGRFAPLPGAEFVPGFIPFVHPQRMSNGNWIIGGHTQGVRTMAVAISAGSDFRKWKVVPIATPGRHFYPETTLLIDGAKVIAVSRNHKYDHHALVAVSRDFGESFTAASSSNLAISDSKPFAGELSTGQRFVIFNGRPNRHADGSRNRNDLVIAVTRPGEVAPFRQAWTVITDLPETVARQMHWAAGPSSEQEWAYPEAVEANGTLYVVFSGTKKSCWLARIPVGSLAAE